MYKINVQLQSTPSVDRADNCYIEINFAKLAQNADQQHKRATFWTTDLRLLFATTISFPGPNKRV